MKKYQSWKRTYLEGKKVETEKLSVHERIKRLENKPFVRPKAKYDNKSSEERINNLLSEGTNNY